MQVLGGGNTGFSAQTTGGCGRRKRQADGETRSMLPTTAFHDQLFLVKFYSYAFSLKSNSGLSSNSLEILIGILISNIYDLDKKFKTK